MSDGSLIEDDAFKLVAPSLRATNEGLSLQVQASIAISLKRIADAIEGTPAKLGVVDTIWEAVLKGQQR